MRKTKIQEMDLEYRFDYDKANPNRFAEKMKLDVGWTVEKFMAEEKKEEGESTFKGKEGRAKEKELTTFRQ